MFGRKKKAAEPFDPIAHIKSAVDKASNFMPAHQVATVLTDIAQSYEIAAAVGCGSRQPWTSGGNGLPPIHSFRQEPKAYENLADIIRGHPR
jgi:hypothetical protein